MQRVRWLVQTLKAQHLPKLVLQVLLDGEGYPVSLSTESSSKWSQNVIMWMDHRAKRQAETINQLNCSALDFLGGKISPEMAIPKILWLYDNLPESFAKIGNFFELPDFLSWRATNSRVRSVCTLVCKWTYDGERRQWDEKLFKVWTFTLFYFVLFN